MPASFNPDQLRTSLCSTWPISKSYASHTAEVESHFNQRK